MKRISQGLIAFILLALCSGCTINYNIEINNDTINEVIEVNDIVMDNRTKEDIYNEYQRWFPVYVAVEEDTPMEYDSSIKVDGIEYHEKTIKDLSNGYYYTYKYIYPIEKYNNASILRQAFEKRKAYVGNDYITLKTDKINLLCNYSYFESLKVNITIDDEIYKLNNTNAHSVDGNTYTWNLNRNNCDASEIILVLDNINKNNEQPGNQNSDDDNNINGNNNTGDNNNINNQNNNISDYTMYIFCGILIIIILIGYFIFKKYQEKNNNYNVGD